MERGSTWEDILSGVPYHPPPPPLLPLSSRHCTLDPFLDFSSRLQQQFVARGKNEREEEATKEGVFDSLQPSLSLCHFSKPP